MACRAHSASAHQAPTEDVNIPELSEGDFDSQTFSLKKGGKVVVFFAASWCPHCVRTKPAFKKFLDMGGVGFIADSDKCKSLIDSINKNAQKAGYEVRGYPTIVSYLNGKYYSTYGYDKANPQGYRSAEDLKAYFDGIGTANIVYV